MKIGVDLDGTVYGHPEFFREFIPAMVSAGHQFYCTSGHRADWWESKDKPRLKELGIDPDLINPAHMQPLHVKRGPEMKARMADHLDIVFDDDADAFQKLTNTPIFKCPKTKAQDRHRTNLGK